MSRTSPPQRHKTSEQELRDVVALLRRVVFGLMGAAVISVVTSVLVVRNVDNNDSTIDTTADNASEVKDYVDELRDVTPDEQARNDAVTKAVQEVPSIKAILCSPEAFPEAEACS
jgi:hypothetical protein